MQHCQQTEDEAEFNYAAHEQPLGYSSRRSGKSPKVPEIAVNEALKIETAETPIEIKDAETNAETAQEPSPDKDDFKKRLEAMMAKGRPPVKAPP